MLRCSMTSELPSTLGALRASVSAGRVPRRSVRDEIRENLIVRLRSGQPIFPGIIGYDETVVPQIVNAVLSRHNFICSGCADRRKAAFSGRSPNCSIRPFRSSPAARFTTIRLRRCARRAAHASLPKETACR